MPSPNNPSDKEGRNSNRDLMRYAGMATQFLAVIGVTVFFGYKADQWLALSFPVFVWLLPLLVITGLIIRMIRDTSNK